MFKNAKMTTRQRPKDKEIEKWKESNKRIQPQKNEFLQ
jgi:hypothetical protein